MLFRRRPRAIAPVIHAVDEDFDDLLAGAPGVTLVDFWAPWCAPCRLMAPLLDEVATEGAEQGVRVMKVNVDRAPETAARFEVRSIPTLVFFRDGEAKFEMVGLVPKPVLDREIGALLQKEE
jgi:thioredoxin 1